MDILTAEQYRMNKFYNGILRRLCATYAIQFHNEASSERKGLKLNSVNSFATYLPQLSAGVRFARTPSTWS